MRPTDSASFAPVFYRYWFFGWLFRDASRGNALERDAALRLNRERARWLPTYIRRWVALGLFMYCAGVGLEWLELDAVAPFAFIAACVTVPVLAVACAAWCVLRSPLSAYVR